MRDRGTPVLLQQTIHLVAANGYSPIPVIQGQKRPPLAGWQKYGPEPADWDTREYWSTRYKGSGLSLVCGNLVIADSDFTDIKSAAKVEKLVVAWLGPTPLKRIGMAPKFQLCYRAAAPIRTRSIPGFDFLSTGRQSVCFNTHPETGLPYMWPDKSPLDVPFSALPAVTPAQVASLLSELQAVGAPQALVTRRADEVSAIGRSWREGEDGQVVDGRDTYLFHLVCNAAVHTQDPERVANMAFAAFQAGADTCRPRTKDGQPWSLAHALEKAKYAVRSASSKRHSYPGVSLPNLEDKRRFVQHVYQECALHGLTRSAVRVSEKMLEFVGHAGGCFVPANRLAHDCGLQMRSVQAARAELVTRGLWLVTQAPDGITLPLYVPNFDVVGQAKS